MTFLPASLRDALTYPTLAATPVATETRPTGSARLASGFSRLLRVLPLLLLSACAIAARPLRDVGSTAPVEGQEAVDRPARADWRAGLHGLAVIDPTLDLHLRRMRAWSPTFDSAMAEIERSPVPIVVGTERQLRDALPLDLRSWPAWQGLSVALPYTREGRPGRAIERAVVVVRLEQLRAALRATEDSALFERSVETLLAHEIYGHLVPQLRLGRTRPIACDDMRDGEVPFDACVVRREQTVVAELNVTRYALRTPRPAVVADAF